MGALPRGWTLSVVVGAGNTASITVPIKFGVVHVLEEVTAELLAFNAAAVAASVNVAVAGGPTLLSLAFPGGAVGRDSDSASGNLFSTSPSTALTVAFGTVTPANYQQLLVIQGYDL